MSDMDPADTRSYRPISNLSVVLKVLERLVTRQLYLDASDLLPRLQSVYPANHSTRQPCWMYCRPSMLAICLPWCCLISPRLSTRLIMIFSFDDSRPPTASPEWCCSGFSRTLSIDASMFESDPQHLLQLRSRTAYHRGRSSDRFSSCYTPGIYLLILITVFVDICTPTTRRSIDFAHRLRHSNFRTTSPAA